MAEKAPRKVVLSKSEQMSRVRSRDTEPELLVRRFLTGLGVRYRLHRRDLPGTPDLYIPRLRLAIFVNGCFWHGHGCSRAGRLGTNVDFWEKKIARNVARDRQTLERLEAVGIEALTLWTCEIREFASIGSMIARRYRKRAT